MSPLCVCRYEVLPFRSSEEQAPEIAAPIRLMVTASPKHGMTTDGNHVSEKRDHPVPSPASRELVRGAVDYHVHVAPDVVERRIDDLALARRCLETGLAGFGLKSHYTSTAERARRRPPPSQ